MKATQEQIDLRRRRIQAVLQIRLDGAETWDVRDFIAEGERAGEDPWTVADGEKPLTAAQIGVIIKAADAAIAESYPNDPPDVARHKARLKNIYARSIQAGDVRTARSILNDLAKIDGLNRRRPAATSAPSKASEATAKLKAKLQRQKKGKSHAKRTPPEADSPAHFGGDVPPGPPRLEPTAAACRHPAEAPALEQGSQGSMG